MEEILNYEELWKSRAICIKSEPTTIHVLHGWKEHENRVPLSFLLVQVLERISGKRLVHRVRQTPRGLYGKARAFFKEYKKATDAGNQKAADEAMTQVLLVGEAEFALTKEFVREHPDNIFSAYISEKAGRENYTKAKELYELLTPQAQQCSWGMSVETAP